MKKNRMLRTILLSTVFALLTIVLMTPVVSADTATSAHRAAAATSQVPASVPNVNIVTRHGRSVFSSSTIHCKSRSGQACFTLTNLTGKSQIVLFNGLNGETSATIPSGFVESFVTLRPGLDLVRLQANPQALLAVLLS
jgi:hypothetical protein